MTSRKFSFGLIAFLFLGLASCGTQFHIGTPRDVGPSIGKNAWVTLNLFGAPWCAECHHDIPAIQRLIDQLPIAKRQSIVVKLYVTTAANPAEPPTQVVADRYRDSLRVTAVSLPDEWRWKNFRLLVGGGLVLPGAAIQDPTGKVLRAFRAGATTFVPSEIVNYAAQAVN